MAMRVETATITVTQRDYATLFCFFVFFACVQIRPYVNGALYSILGISTVREAAKEMVNGCACVRVHARAHASTFVT